jgi:16S rRNA methyltransferase RsmB/F
MAALTERHRKNGVKCKIFAFDKNPRRAKLLQMRMESAGAQKIIDVSNEDFLNVDVSSLKFISVSCILLDPSCSGSGVARALERVIERGVDEGALPKLRTEIDFRLEKLRAFQLAALRKAMSFPSARYIVYSTCSIFKEENESVIAEALGLVSSSGLVLNDFVDSTAAWTLVEPLRLANWTRRGDPYPGLPVDLQKKLIRCHPSDGLNGFFVAVLKRECSIDTAASRSTSFPETSAVGSICPLVMARPAPTSSQVISPKRKRKFLARDYDSSLHSDTVESVSAALSVKAQKVTTSSHMATPKRIHSRPFLKAFKQKRR